MSCATASDNPLAPVERVVADDNGIVAGGGAAAGGIPTEKVGGAGDDGILIAEDATPSDEGGAPPKAAAVVTPLRDIAGIYVVGGASALPNVTRALRERFGRRVHRSQHPGAAIAIGLAVASEKEAGFELVDRFSRHFGVFREGEHGDAVTFDPIFSRETRLPAAGDAPIVCRRVYRAAHNVGHYRFVECASVDEHGAPAGEMTPFADVRFAFDGRLRRGDVDLTRVPVRPLSGEGPRIEEHYSVDGYGLVSVRIADLDAGYERHFRLASGA